MLRYMEIIWLKFPQSVLVSTGDPSYSERVANSQNETQEERPKAKSSCDFISSHFPSKRFGHSIHKRFTNTKAGVGLVSDLTIDWELETILYPI